MRQRQSATTYPSGKKKLVSYRKKKKMSKRMKTVRREIFVLHVNWMGAEDVAARWGMSYHLSVSSLAKFAPNVQRVLDALCAQQFGRLMPLQQCNLGNVGYYSGNSLDHWEMRFDNTDDFTKHEDSRSTSGVLIDDEVLYEEMNELMQAPTQRTGTVVGSIVFHLKM